MLGYINVSKILVFRYLVPHFLSQQSPLSGTLHMIYIFPFSSFHRSVLSHRWLSKSGSICSIPGKRIIRKRSMPKRSKTVRIRASHFPVAHLYCTAKCHACSFRHNLESAFKYRFNKSDFYWRVYRRMVRQRMRSPHWALLYVTKVDLSVLRYMQSLGQNRMPSQVS